MRFLRSQDRVAFVINKLREWQREHFPKSHLFANSGRKVTRAENVEDLNLILFHELDGLFGQMTSNTESTILWIHRKDFSVYKAVDVRVEFKNVELRVDEVHQTHDLLEFGVVCL